MSESTPAYGTSVAARLTRQGQITVPKAVREALGATPGDELVFEALGDEIVVRHRPRRSALAFAGIATATAPRPGLTRDALTETVEREVGEAYAMPQRSRSRGSATTPRPRAR